MTAPSRRVRLHEVGPRDGLQAEAAFVPTEAKIALVEALADTGVAQVEVTAFVSPRAIPALADAEAVMRALRRRPDVDYVALVPNARGADRAVACAVDAVNLVMSATEGHNRANLRMDRSTSLATLADAAAVARAGGVRVDASLSCAFGCPIDGDVPATDVLDACARLVDGLGADGLTLCDTTGMAFPTQVAALVRAVRARWPALPLTLHFHDTRGLAVANALAALAEGADRFDASVGGLGGCPYAPGATGNVSTETLAHAFALVGVETGVDVDRLVAIARGLPALVGRDVGSPVSRAGPRDGRPRAMRAVAPAVA